MEDIFGIIIFILFIAFRTMGDRSKGMKKKAVPPKVKETAPRSMTKNRQATVKTVPPPKTEPFRQAQDPKQPAFGAIPPAVASVRKIATVPLGEGESIYDNLPYMEGYDNTSGMQLSAVYEENKQDIVPRYGLAAEDLRQAIIWSELIEKPRFRKKQVR